MKRNTVQAWVPGTGATGADVSCSARVLVLMDHWKPSVDSVKFKKAKVKKGDGGRTPGIHCLCHLKV